MSPLLARSVEVIKEAQTHLCSRCFAGISVGFFSKSVSRFRIQRDIVGPKSCGPEISQHSFFVVDGKFVPV